MLRNTEILINQKKKTFFTVVFELILLIETLFY